MDNKTLNNLYDITAEAGVLGSMLLAPASIGWAIDTAQADDFYLPEHRVYLKH